MSTQNWARSAVPHNEIIEAADRLIQQADARRLLLQPGSGPVHRTRGVEVSRALWEKVRGLALSRGFAVAADRAVLGTEQAARFASALRASAEQTAGWTKREREAFDAVLALLKLGRGLLVSRVQ